MWVKKSPCVKYTWELINNIKNEYKKINLTVKDLSLKYNITKRYIRSIVENKKLFDENYDPKLTKEQFIARLKGKRKNLGENHINSKLKKKI